MEYIPFSLNKITITGTKNDCLLKIYYVSLKTLE